MVSTISRHAQVGELLDEHRGAQLRVRLRAPLAELRARRPQIDASELAAMDADPWPFRVDLQLAPAAVADWVERVLARLDGTL